MKSNTSVIYAVALLGFFLLGIILWNIDYDEESYVECSTPLPPVLFCGTVSPYNKDLSDQELAGEAIYHANCAACHKVQKRMTGPALSKVLQAYPSDSLFHKYLIKSKPLEGKRCFQFEKLTLENASQLRDFIAAYK
ncbi:c-type cytochrome [Dokdonia sp. PRO95]|uniref:c-type cytochrome n=1 Tax=Dokdonia sp. PRO95 TaxID=1239415 RepID=UPI0005566A6C|nr:c-type cytochrome [Dokdonia sp. PRO95]